MQHYLKIIIVVQLVLIAFLVLLLTGVIDWDRFPEDDSQNNNLGTSLSKSDKGETLESGDQNYDRSGDRANNDFFSLRKANAGANEDNQYPNQNRSSIPDNSLTPSIEDNPFAIDLEKIQKNSPFAPEEIYHLDVTDDLWGYFRNHEDRVKRFREMDESISLVNYRGKNFKSSELAQYLKLISSKIRLYVLLEFTQPLGPEIFYRLRSYGFNTVPQLKREHYYRKLAGIFYVPYSKLKNIYKSEYVRGIYIIDRYTASVKYQLGIKSFESIDSIEFKINYPYSKPGLSVSNLNYYFKGPDPFSENDVPEKNLLVVNTPITQDELYLFTSQYTLRVDLLENLKRSFVASAKGVSLENYWEMIETVPEIKQIFTRPGEKIVTSEYVNNILRQINTDMDISGIWKQISFILDKDIEYDWQKRELFFSGNLPYYNIKDMYLNVAELSEKKVGACTERTSLEIAILRELNIAARSATRVYHIFTEIYLPGKGWTTTSLILNEIPLCHSYDENMAYFVEWNKSFPIRLKWVGKIIPHILKGSFPNSELVRR